MGRWAKWMNGANVKKNEKERKEEKNQNTTIQRKDGHPESGDKQWRREEREAREGDHPKREYSRSCRPTVRRKNERALLQAITHILQTMSTRKSYSLLVFLECLSPSPLTLNVILILILPHPHSPSVCTQDHTNNQPVIVNNNSHSPSIMKKMTQQGQTD